MIGRSDGNGGHISLLMMVVYNIVPALDSVTMDNFHNHFRKVRHYMFAYLEGVPGAFELEKLVKDYEKAIKSHRRISEHQ